MYFYSVSLAYYHLYWGGRARLIYLGGYYKGRLRKLFKQLSLNVLQKKKNKKKKHVRRFPPDPNSRWIRFLIKRRAAWGGRFVPPKIKMRHPRGKNKIK